jgi:FkbM family methyltransferase
MHKGSVEKRIDGITYKLDVKELIDRAIYIYGYFESDVTAFINRFTQKGMTVFDIGANIGCHALRFGKLVGTTGRVIAFEPMSYAYGKLKQNVGLNKFNITVEKIALSNVSTIANAVFRSSWTLDKSKKTNVKTAEKLVFMTLDEYVDQHHIGKIDLIKIDVDGYELKVLTGGKRSIGNFKPIILIELGEYTLDMYGDDLYSLIDLLFSLNYQIFISDLKNPLSKQQILQLIPKHSTVNALALPYIMTLQA